MSSEYAVIAAEQTAQENLARDIANQIVIRVATRLRESDMRLRQAESPGQRP